MATTAQIRAYAKANNVTMAEAKAYTIHNAKGADKASVAGRNKAGALRSELTYNSYNTQDVSNKKTFSVKPLPEMDSYSPQITDAAMAVAGFVGNLMILSQLAGHHIGIGSEPYGTEGIIQVKSEYRDKKLSNTVNLLTLVWPSAISYVNPHTMVVTKIEPMTASLMITLLALEAQDIESEIQLDLKEAILKADQSFYRTL